MADSTSQTIFTTDRFTGPAERTFPGGTTYQEFVAQETAAGTFEEIKAGLPEKVRNQFLDMALEGGREDAAGNKIDLNSYFGTPIGTIFRKDMKGLYPAAQAAYKREKEGNATPDDVQLLEKVRDPNGVVMKSITSLSYGHPVLGQGYVDTGTLPRNTLTGEYEGMDIIPRSVVGEGRGGVNFFDTSRDVAVRRAEDSEKLLRWVRSQPDLQNNDLIQNALVQAVEGDVFDIVAERLYMYAAGTEEGVGHYFPRFVHWATNYGLTSENTAGMLSAENYLTEEDIAQDLASFRNSAFFANRQEVVNDIIRDQLMEMGLENELREAGYLETQDVDGVTRYTKNFVSQDFAEGFMEEVYNTQSLTSKFATFIVENVAGFTALKAPFQGAANAQRLIRRSIDNVRGEKVIERVPGGESKVLGITVKSDPEDVVVGRTNRPSSFTTPDGDFEVAQKFSIASPEDQLRMATEYAALKDIPLREAARQLALMDSGPRFWNKWTSNRIVERLGVEVNRNTVVAAGADSVERIRELTRKLRNAQLDGNENDILKFSEQLRNERAYANWRKVKTIAPYAQSYGINPTFDIFMAGSQVAAREAMGPMGELVAAGSLVAGMGVLSFFNIKYPKGIPYVSGVAARTSFAAKKGTEDALAFLFEFSGTAARGYAQGWLVNPGVRGLLGASPEELRRGGVSNDQIRQIQSFSKEFFSNMSPPQREMAIDMMDQGFNDVNKVVSSFEGTLSYENMMELRRALSLNLGQSTGMHVFMALHTVTEVNKRSLTAKAIAKVNKKMRDNLDMQYEAEKQVAAMGLAVDQLDRVILNIEKEIKSGTLPSPEDMRVREAALDSLRVLSGSFRNAEEYGVKSIQQIIKADVEAADRILTELTLASNSKLLEEAFLSGEIDDLLAIYGRMDRRVGQFSQAAPEGKTAPGAVTTPDYSAMFGTELTTPQQLRESGTKVEEALTVLRDAIKATVAKGRVSSSAVERATTQNTSIASLVKLTESASKLRVDEAYKAIGTDVVIPLDILAIDMETFVKSFASDQRSFLKMIDPSRMTMGGSAGENFIRALDRAASTGLEEAVTKRLDDINEVTGPLGFTFTDARSYLTDVRRAIMADETPEIVEMRLANGFDSPDDISDAQLMFILLENPEFAAIDVRSLRLMASAQDLETLRQGANSTIRKFGDGDERSKYATNLISGIDKAFDTWGQGANLEQYNAVVLARKMHQLERQRFGKGTFAYKVNTVLGEERISEGKVEVGNTAGISALVEPIMAFIKNPKAESGNRLQGAMDDIFATFAPVTTTMAEQVLVKNADGRYILPKTEDLTAVSTKVMTEASFKELQTMFDVLVRNALFEQSNMEGVRSALNAGRIPALDAKDAPKRLKVPTGFMDEANPQEAYLMTLQRMFTAQVLDEDTGTVVTRNLFDFEDVIMQDRNIVEVVNAVPAYRETHSDLVAVANTARDEIATTGKSIQEGEIARLKEVGKAAKFASGQGFVDNVLLDTDPRSFDLFVNRIESTQKYVSLSADEKTDSYRALFTEVIKNVGGYERGRGAPVRMFDGQTVRSDAYTSPDQIFLLLDDALTSGGATQGMTTYKGASEEGRKFLQLAEKAGVTQDQLETLHAIFRLSVRTEAGGLAAKGRAAELEGGVKLKELTKGFTLDNALSKAFNLARGMVSKEYVAAEIALRYAALAQGKSVDFLLDDPKAAGIVHNLLKQDDLVGPEDAKYFATALMKFVAADLPAAAFQVDVGSDQYAEEYWISRGLLFQVDPQLQEAMALRFP